MGPEQCFSVISRHRPCVGSSREGRSRLEAGHATWVIKSCLRHRCHGSSAHLLWWGWLVRWLWKSTSYCRCHPINYRTSATCSRSAQLSKGSWGCSWTERTRSAFARWMQWATLCLGGMLLEDSLPLEFSTRCLHHSGNFVCCSSPLSKLARSEHKPKNDLPDMFYCWALQ